VAVKRRYESARRQEQARETRRAILEPAGRLFVDPGYAATPLTAVAAEAGVVVQTLYAAFGNKRRLLSELVDVTIAGDDERVAVPERPFVAAVRAIADARGKLARFARRLAEIHERRARVMLALAGAATASPDVADIVRKNDDDRYRGMTMFAADLAATGELRPGLAPDQVADALWLAQDVRNYDWPVRRRGWPVERYRQWFVDTVAGVLRTGTGAG
jgi:TetR/AcrR family transcriptional regulator of autoinduction and epiphytic fitness